MIRVYLGCGMWSLQKRRDETVSASTPLYCGLSTMFIIIYTSCRPCWFMFWKWKDVHKADGALKCGVKLYSKYCLQFFSCVKSLNSRRTLFFKNLRLKLTNCSCYLSLSLDWKHLEIVFNYHFQCGISSTCISARPFEFVWHKDYVVNTCLRQSAGNGVCGCRSR